MSQLATSEARAAGAGGTGAPGQAGGYAEPSLLFRGHRKRPPRRFGQPSGVWRPVPRVLPEPGLGREKRADPPGSARLGREGERKPIAHSVGHANEMVITPRNPAMGRNAVSRSGRVVSPPPARRFGRAADAQKVSLRRISALRQVVAPLGEPSMVRGAKALEHRPETRPIWTALG